MMRADPVYAARAAKVSGLARDISEYLAKLGIMPPVTPSNLTVAYHSACSLQHGQRVHREPSELLAACGFVVKDIPEAHLCCGSAGTYNILQPDIAARLRDRKIAQYRDDRSRHHRGWQYRLHYADRAQARRSRWCIRSN